MEGQYQFLYKENVLMASSAARMSGRQNFVVFYKYSQSWNTVIY